jgi:hypothetical protein
MKHHPIIILLLVLPFCAIANRIDSIKTYVDVNKLLAEVYNKYYRQLDSNEYNLTYAVPAERKIADSLHTQIWQKVDINNDGRTDLIVHYHEDIIVIIDSNGKLKSVVLRKEINPPTLFPVVTKDGNNVKLCIYTINDSCKKYKKNDPYRKNFKIQGSLRMNCTTLIYKYNNFIELNNSPKPAINNIREIVFKTPHLNLNILTANRLATKELTTNMGSRKTYTATIDTANFSRIMALINYIDINSLRSSYRTSGTDLTTCEFGVVYNGGGVKGIEDYGLHGTYGLMAIYKELTALNENQAWKLTSQ